ncbi:TSUP family transporter [Mesorhizobium sp. RP14(2022)]|uniref:Probable membrane transporter protein n=1 Tax=Mesorhizobium liriopis TaxID=2953882 RepID=A0ABT1C5Q5_9HYPH|nr:TSUP family transporter [Mesorhizobium liriopis]MCO6050107.1 TSUP family transporter [Mesorhizobium liriopis]
MFDPSLETIILLAIAALGAGFIDAVAGGGGLITVPALLVAGLPPVQALGTNKLQGIFGSASATIAYAMRGQVKPLEQWPSALLACAGSVGGALLATVLPADVLKVFLPVMLVAIAVYFVLKRDLSDVDRVRRLSPAAFALLIATSIGFYDGMFGPGTGSFFMLAFVSLAGFGMLKATAHTKFLNFASNFGSLILFAGMGLVSWKIGLAMGVAQFVGAQLGAHFAVRGGAKVIRPLLVLVSLALAARTLFAAESPLWEWIGS